jgi:hypothetical protein
MTLFQLRYLLAVSVPQPRRRLLTAAVRVRGQISPLGFVVEKLALEQIYLQYFRFSSVSIIPPSLYIDLRDVWGLGNESVRAAVPVGHSLTHRTGSNDDDDDDDDGDTLRLI